VSFAAVDGGAVPIGVSLRNRSASSEKRKSIKYQVKRVSGLNPDVVKLVSLQAPAGDSVADTQAQAVPTQVFATPQQPTFQQVDGSAFAGPSATQGTWVLVAPYGWISGLSGRVGVGSHVANIGITPTQALSHLGDVDGALMLHTEVGRGNWGFILDANLIKASTQTTAERTQVGVSLQQTLLEALGMYRFFEASNYWVEGKSLTVDFLAGGRYYEFGNALTITPFNPILPTVQANQSMTWVDMVFGGRTRIPITSSIDGFARADIGGFGIGSSSKLAWNVVAGADWQLNKCSSLVAGYRVLNIDQSGSSGGTPFLFNVQLYGPFMALAFQF